jgi:hypothetical protein
VRRGKKWVAKKPVVTEATLEFEVYDIEADPFLAAASRRRRLIICGGP